MARAASGSDRASGGMVTRQGRLSGKALPRGLVGPQDVVRVFGIGERHGLPPSGRRFEGPPIRPPVGLSVGPLPATQTMVARGRAALEAVKVPKTGIPKRLQVTSLFSTSVPLMVPAATALLDDSEQTEAIGESGPAGKPWPWTQDRPVRYAQDPCVLDPSRSSAGVKERVPSAGVARPSLGHVASWPSGRSSGPIDALSLERAR
jgi:hypothetical protein